MNGDANSHRREWEQRERAFWGVRLWGKKKGKGGGGGKERDEKKGGKRGGERERGKWGGGGKGGEGGGGGGGAGVGWEEEGWGGDHLGEKRTNHKPSHDETTKRQFIRRSGGS